MTIFEYILAPFIFIIKQLFLLGYAITGNYGLSIVFLSLTISLLLLPIFVFIEKAKKKEDALKLRMKPFVDEIKRCYKGQERYYYLKTIHRQYSYSSIRALIPTLSLIIQIPFFIAAYQFLEKYELLSGVQFLFIKDLYAPDALFGSINALPIAMTVVNLITAYFYTRNGDGSELKQMVIVAGIFLILLFNLPAGLVLYWTMNNVFSFFRLFITNPEVFKRNEQRTQARRQTITDFKNRINSVLPKLKTTFLFAISVGLVIELNNAVNNGLSDIATKLLNVIAYSLAITFSIGLLTVIHKKLEYPRGVKGKDLLAILWSNFKVMFIVVLIVIVGSQINWVIMLEEYSVMPQRIAVAIIGSIISVSVLSFVVLFYQGTIQVSAGAYQIKPSRFTPKQQLKFKITISALLAAQIILALVFNFENFFLEVFISFAIAWVIFITSINRRLIFSQERTSKVRSAITQLLKSTNLLFAIIFLGIYFMLAGQFYFEEPSFQLNIIGLISILLAQALGINLFLKQSKKEKSRTRLFLKQGILLVSLVQLFLIAIVFLKINQIQFLSITYIANTYSLITSVSITGLAMIIITLPYSLKFTKFNIKLPKSPTSKIYFISLVYLLSLIFFWSPLLVYSSFPETFSFPSIQIFARNFPFFGVSAVILTILYFISPAKIRYLLSVLLGTISIVFFVNSFIIPVDVGSLQMGQYVEAENLAMEWKVFAAEAIFLIVTFLGMKWLITKEPKLVGNILSILLVIALSQSIIVSISQGGFFSKDDSYKDLPSSISFSKDKQNIIFIIPDSFMAIYMKDILKDSSELSDKLDGFVWYPNTLSVSTHTSPSISSMLLGPSHNLDILNQDESRTMSEKITDASEEFSTKVKDKGYNLTSTKMIYSEIDKHTYDAYLPKWHPDWNKWNKDLKIGGAKELDFTILWKNALFYGSPLFYKSKLYKNGEWIKVDEETNKNTSLSKGQNFIRLLPYISDTNSSKGNFIYIHTKATHPPWNIVDDNGEINMNVPAYDCQKWFLQKFAIWIDWMKKNGVYDNTKIVMASDHTHTLDDEAYNGFGGEYSWNEEGQKILQSKYFWRVNTLLMVKDFNSKGTLKENWNFMSNSDVSAIAFDEPVDTSATRTLPVFYVDAIPRSALEHTLPIFMQFNVKDSIFDPKNWEPVK